MKWIIIMLIVAFTFGVSIVFNEITGDVIGNSETIQEEHIGPSAEDIACLESCIVVGCEPGEQECITANSKKCEQECGVEPEPKPADEGETCMQNCVSRGCDERDFNCQGANIEKCEQECGMIGEPEAKNEEEQCIKDCINKIDPNIKCSSGTFEGEGETGNEACQKCAKSCEYLYDGPCLTDELWKEKENACIAQCEHCYGEPVRGPSGEGYECTIDIKCSDASSEFGDDAGTGEDSYEEGHGIPEIIANVGNTVKNIVGEIGKFFKGLFD